MSRARLAARIDGMRHHAVGQLHDFDLAFDKPGKDGTGKANVRPSHGARVHGVVWQIEAPALSTLDRFEPGYARHEFEIAIEARPTIVAWTYVYTGVTSDAAPSVEYVQHLLAGAREHALPRDLVVSLEALHGGITRRS